MANIKSSHDRIGKGFNNPSEHVESAGEQLIKELAQKQISTKINLDNELKRKKNFELSSRYLAVTEFTSGINNLDQFNEINAYITDFEQLYKFGLSDDDVQFYLTSLNGLECLRSIYKNLSNELLETRLQNIINKIERSKLNDGTSISTNVINRQENELALCVKPSSIETKLYKFAKSCETNSNSTEIAKDHPINSLPQLENELFGHLKLYPIPELEKRRKRARKLLDEPLKLSVNEPNISVNNVQNKRTKWDLKESIINSEKKLYTCKPECFYTIKNNTIVKYNDNIEKSCVNSKNISNTPFVGGSNSLISLEHIKKYKLQLDEVKKIPKFQNYQCGEPNNILFVKNLHSTVTENDLIKIFSNFQQRNENKIIYRVMTGRMKGQAFITFCSKERAQEALEIVNGYLLNGQPIILQYGRKNQNKITIDN